MATKTQTKRFRGSTAKEAEDAAIAWSTDLGQHDSIAVESVTTVKKSSKFVATIVYRK